jgi:hypothetical protein
VTRRDRGLAAWRRGLFILVLGALVGVAQAFQDLVRKSAGGMQGEFQRICIGDAHALEVRVGGVHFLAELFHVHADAVHQNDLDIQAAKDRYIEQ